MMKIHILNIYGTIPTQMNRTLAETQPAKNYIMTSSGKVASI
ncbi:uncharacterized protein METZ01_LOCUS476272 [marine metagenome]|uniref:Uncharacterized protein n=1 Tax=marine metagenome TaxID=408172 RepID=A0A383BVL4_9ZZZZ